MKIVVSIAIVFPLLTLFGSAALPTESKLENDAPVLQRAELISKAGELETLAATYERNGTNKPHTPYQLLLNSLRRIYHDLGDREHENAVYEKYVKLDPSNTFMLADYARFLEASGRLGDSERVLWASLIHSSRRKPTSAPLLPDEFAQFARSWKPGETPTADEIAQVREIALSPQATDWKGWCSENYVALNANTEANQIEDFYLRTGDAAKAVQVASKMDIALVDYLSSGRPLGFVLADALQRLYAQANSKSRLCKCLYAAAQWERLAEESQLAESFSRKARELRSSMMHDSNDLEPWNDERKAQFQRAEALMHLARTQDAMPLYLELLRYKIRKFPSVETSPATRALLQELKVVSGLNALIDECEIRSAKAVESGQIERARTLLQLAKEAAEQVAGNDQDNIDNFWERAGLSDFPLSKYDWRTKTYTLGGKTLLKEDEIRSHAAEQLKRLAVTRPNPALARITRELNKLTKERFRTTH
jgi:hypothetical protein